MKKKPEKGKFGAAIVGVLTHPWTEVAFLPFLGFALPGGPVGSDKNTLSGAALSPAISGLLGCLRCSPLCQFFFGGGPGGGVCQMEKHKKQQQKQQSEEEKEKEEEEEEEEPNE